MIIKTYPIPIEMTVKTAFTHAYIAFSEGDEFTKYKEFKIGDTLLVLGKIKSNVCDSGYGYIGYDPETQEAAIYTIALFEL